MDQYEINDEVEFAFDIHDEDKGPDGPVIIKAGTRGKIMSIETWGWLVEVTLLTGETTWVTATEYEIRHVAPP